MIELVEDEVKKIENDNNRTIVVCFGIGCLTLIAIAESLVNRINKENKEQMH